jgi:two-component system phosphate regulon sensor histidine kinase PhoR
VQLGSTAIGAFRVKLIAATLATAAITLLAAFRLSPWGAGAVAVVAALLVAWRVSAPVSRRLRRVVATARRYAAADLPRWPETYGDDDIGQVVRVMDEAVLEQRRRLSELAGQQARMEAILSEMAEGVLIVDRHGRVQLINEVARRLLSGPVTPGDHYIETVRHPGIVTELTGALRGERPDPLEVTLDEGRRSVSAQATPASAAAGGGAVLVLHDITALLAADRIRRDFVANVSHELRTPLTAVRGYIEALQDDSLEPEERLRFLGVVARHTDRMERLVGDLLRLARIEAGQEILEVVACDTGALLQSAHSELATVIQARNLTIDVRVAPEAGRVTCDPAKLHDALRNLLENAVNYSPEGGCILLRAAVEGDVVALSVADDGPGVPEEAQARIFERFYRVDKSRARDPGGTGLGLSIAKHLVELHGGRVGVENRQPHGALFTIQLPRQTPGQPRAWS